MSVSFEAELGADIRAAASAEGITVSAWLAKAARDRVRTLILGDVMREWQERHGAFTPEEIAAAEADFDRAAQLARPRRRKAG